MQEFVEDCLRQPSFERQRRVLERVVSRPRLHARWLNTLARLEYVGVRKMLKTRRSETLDLDGLRHILEEAAHATRLKKAALTVSEETAWVATFSDEHTLCGDAAERYFQAIDREVARLVRGRSDTDEETCYLLTSAAIELRARSFYPAYQQVLEATASSISVLSIIGDEQEHLQHMASQLPQRLSDWSSVLRDVMAVEERQFVEYLDLVEGLLQAQ